MAVASGKKRQLSLSLLLPELVRARGWEKQLEHYALFTRWPELVSGDLASYARPLKVERGVLWLEVDNSSWLQQFQYAKVELLDTLNRALSRSTLQDIRMVLPTVRAKDEPVPQPAVRLRFVSPDEEKLAGFRGQAEGIADDQCREALVRLWYLAHSCRREKS